MEARILNQKVVKLEQKWRQPPTKLGVFGDIMSPFFAFLETRTLHFRYFWRHDASIQKFKKIHDGTANAI